MIESTKLIPPTHTLLMDGSPACHDLHQYLEINELSVPVVIEWINPGNVEDSQFPILLIRNSNNYQEITGLKAIKFCLPSTGKRGNNSAGLARLEKVKYVATPNPETAKIPA